MKRTLAIDLAVFVSPLMVVPCFGQTTFFRTYGAPSNERALSVEETADGGYMAVGHTYSWGAGSRDVLLFRTDAGGNSIWDKTYGGSGEDYALTLDRIADTAFVIGGHTSSFGQGGHDYYLLKVDLNGDTLVSRSYGGAAPDGIYDIKETPPGADAYIMAGHTSSYGAGGHDFYAIKVNPIGDTLWTLAMGGDGGDYLRGCLNIVELVDIPLLGFIGETNSFGAGGFDVLFTTADISGQLQMSKTYGSTGNDFGYSVVESGDGGFLITGHTNSSGAGLNDVYAIRLNVSGDVLWSKTYGGIGDDFAYSAQRTVDGGYIIAGSTNSFGGGASDAYLIRTDASGDTLWTKTYGSTGNEDARSVRQTADGGFILAGYSNSFDQSENALLIKTDANGITSCNMHSTSTMVSDAVTTVNNPLIQVDHGTVSEQANTVIDDAPVSNLDCPIVGIAIPDNGLEEASIWPNPTERSSTISYALNTSTNVQIVARNIHGQVINSVSEGRKSAGKHTYELNTDGLAAGIYTVQLRTENAGSTLKLIVN